MSETVLNIQDMTCMHCTMAVEKALKAVPGVTDVKVDLAGKKAVVTGSAERSVLAEAVTKAGYEVVS
ncbi:MAG: Copper-transporting P-type ATPase [Syntrophorhabdaceae bacterium PtaU1.Bin034]|nr:MAG: Copper-transporting P-type ATPase [Syntrophorhabdaceae bacterium PtaU1.Bin034]